MEPQGSNPGVTDPVAGDQVDVASQNPPAQEPISDRGSYDPSAPPPANDQGPVPYERFSQVNAEKAMMAQQIAERDRQLQLYQAQLGQARGGPDAPPPQQQQVPQMDPVQEMLSTMEDDDMVEGKQVKELFVAMNQRQAALERQQAFHTSHPDYVNLVGSPQNLAEPMQKVLASNPAIAQDIANSPNPMQTAYNYAAMYQNMSRQLGGQQIPQQTPVAQPIPGQQVHPSAVSAFNAARTPVSPANAGSGAGYSRAHRYANMSDEEFAAHRRSVAER